MQKKLKVATVGTGYFSQFHYNAWARIQEVEVVALCNRSATAAASVAQEYSIPATYSDFVTMLDETKPDLVDIITPPQTHVEYVTAAIERGIPCICQKPFTTSFENAEKLTRLIQEKNAMVVIHENFRFQPWYQEIKSILSSQQLGSLYNLGFRLRPGDGQGEDAYLARQPYFRDMERFLIHETGIHWVDVFRYLLGEVESVYADLQQLNPVINGEDAGIVLFRFADNIRATFDGNRLADHAAENMRLTMGEMQIEGSKGSLKLEGNGKISTRKTGESTWTPHEYAFSTLNFGGDCVYNLQKHVVEHIINSSELHNSAHDYMTNIKIEDWIYQSASLGKRINTR
ncbi:Gfo/Idh/MocA family oxidoreductase [Marinomonas sp. 15G1-11]|uniref:Gfo/Idh/MocA family oxidoreductase n=1 Tax=Marinomonas phaeophyticola TaxID=3004091 RepID=A0ABT4JR18_9GAMM|nr:Gfo/Idh/MocA family oxidoreductase [Marinomonas sp. 15G1-11]MCZ2720837.1 Gfo/Idh/MocA family oxidoreductase [Marinomonas sp. 15G1-11]